MGVELVLLRGQHRAARAAAPGPRRDRGRERERCRSRPRCSCSTTRRATARPAPRGTTRRSTEVIALEPAARQGRERQRAAAARPRPLRAAAQRGLRAAAGATAALHAALDAHPRRRRRGRAAAAPRRRGAAVSAGASRRPRPRSLGALMLHRRFTVQSRGERTRDGRLGQSAALLVRSEAARADRLVRPGVLRLLRRGRLLQAPARRRLAHALRPAARRDPPRAAVDRRGARAADRRAVTQPRPLHAQAPLAAGRATRARLLTAWTYALRAAAALVLPGHDPRRYWRHVTATLCPARGEGLREAAADHNRGPRL